LRAREGSAKRLLEAKRERLRQQEFEKVALVHAASLLRVAVRICRERHLAEDLTQEALLNAWRAFDQFQPGTNCKAWLFKIMFNLFSKWRSRMAIPLISIEQDANWPEPFVPPAPDPLEHSDVFAALAALKEEHRVVLLLGVVEELSCKEIAGLLHLPLGTVMSRLSRGRAALREQLEQLRSHAPQSGERMLDNSPGGRVS
jgi:RNA polymerase sigma-70 factor (ECF subfamily)